MSMRPCADSTCFTRRSMSASRDTSHGTEVPPISSATAFAPDSSMSATTIAFACSEAKRLASARPIPRAAPVTITTLSVRRTASSPECPPEPSQDQNDSSWSRLIVAGKSFLWKTQAGSFRRHRIPHRISPHGRRGPRLQRTLSARYRADRETLDWGGRESTHSRTCSLQPIARRYSGNQRSSPDRAASRARDGRHRGKARRPGTAGASELSIDVARTCARTRAGRSRRVGRELAFGSGRCGGLSPDPEFRALISGPPFLRSAVPPPPTHLDRA